MIDVAFPIDQSRIKEEATRVREALRAAQEEYRQLRLLLNAIEQSCKHKHESSGWDERDGRYASPCVYCGYSY